MRREWDVSPKDTCFVICPLGGSNSEVRNRSDMLFRDIIKPAAAKNRLKTLRADHIDEPGMITTQVINHILKDKVVVADLTDRNPNVFYEYALRHAFQKPVVQLLYAGQEVPFSLVGTRTIEYGSDSVSQTRAREELEKQIAAVLKPGYRVVSPVKAAAATEKLRRHDVDQLILATIQEQFERFNSRRDKTEQMLAQYARELELLKDVKTAGISGICKCRNTAIVTFARAIEEEKREIMVIGSSLKGLLQKEEFREVRERLRFKAERGMVHVKFLLTHPIVADLRAKAENLRPTGIGLEIINSLQILKRWNSPHRHVRLYLGTPTCFAIKTSNKMLINPYPYQSASYDSPCLLLEYLASDRNVSSGFFFEEFNRAHFAAWDSGLAIQIDNFEAAIESLRTMLPEYAAGFESLLDRGKSLERSNQRSEKHIHRKQNAVSGRNSNSKGKSKYRSSRLSKVVRGGK